VFFLVDQKVAAKFSDTSPKVLVHREAITQIDEDDEQIPADSLIDLLIAPPDI
jgi:hypothetical protein